MTRKYIETKTKKSFKKIRDQNFIQSYPNLYDVFYSYNDAANYIKLTATDLWTEKTTNKCYTWHKWGNYS